MGIFGKFKRVLKKKESSSSLIIEHMEVDFVFSRMHKKTHLRILDIGAHHGEFCQIFERHGNMHSYDVICVEPMPQNCKILKSNIRNLHRVSATICECAVSDVSGPRIFYAGDYSTLFTMTPEWKEFFPNSFSNQQEVEVECYTIKDLFSQYQIDDSQGIDFVKIDAEGHDYNIIRSLIHANIKPFALMFEIHPHIDESIVAIEYLLKNEYSEIYVFGRSGIPTTYIGEYVNSNRLIQLREKGRLITGNVVAFLDT